jgi:hypothetical protein
MNNRVLLSEGEKVYVSSYDMRGEIRLVHPRSEWPYLVVLENGTQYLLQNHSVKPLSADPGAKSD